MGSVTIVRKCAYLVTAVEENRINYRTLALSVMSYLLADTIVTLLREKSAPGLNYIRSQRSGSFSDLN